MVKRIKNFRVISRLDIKNNTVIKGIHLEGLRKVGVPAALAKKYYDDSADEILFMDAVASLYGRNHLFDILTETSKNIFIPVTVGGGLKTIDDVRCSLDSGADKVSVNTGFVKNPLLINEIASKYGSQCCVCSIEAKKIANKKWEVYIDNGREPTGMDVCEWVEKASSLGIGELIVTSIDQEGTKKGFDIYLYEEIRKQTNVPVIASGGAGNIQHIKDVKNAGVVDGVALASVLHYNLLRIVDIKAEL